jgi:hypothetical protein
MLFYVINSFIALIDEVIKLNKIPWRIAANAEFTEYNKIGATLFGNTYCGNYFVGIAFKIADVIILLRKKYFHYAKLAVYLMRFFLK